MKSILPFLEQLDLSEIESKLYVTLLETGPITVRELAATTDMKRTTAYLYIDQLIEKGLVLKIVRGSNKLIAATDPEDSLKYIVKQKLQAAKEIQNSFPSVLEAINTTLPQANVSEAEIKYYKGKAGVRKVYEEALQAKVLCSYVNIAEIAGVFPENFDLFNNAFKENKDLVMYEICEDSPQARERIKSSRKNHLYKILPKDMKFSAQDILIYEDKIAIIHFKNSVSCIVLRNADLYNNFRLLFDFIWKILPE